MAGRPGHAWKPGGMGPLAPRRGAGRDPDLHAMGVARRRSEGPPATTSRSPASTLKTTAGWWIANTSPATTRWPGEPQVGSGRVRNRQGHARRSGPRRPALPSRRRCPRRATTRPCVRCDPRTLRTRARVHADRDLLGVADRGHQEWEGVARPSPQPRHRTPSGRDPRRRRAAWIVSSLDQQVRHEPVGGEDCVGHAVGKAALTHQRTGEGGASVVSAKVVPIARSAAMRPTVTALTARAPRCRRHDPRWTMVGVAATRSGRTQIAECRRHQRPQRESHRQRAHQVVAGPARSRRTTRRVPAAPAATKMNGSEVKKSESITGSATASLASGLSRLSKPSEGGGAGAPV